MTYLGQKHILTQVCFEAWNIVYVSFRVQLNSFLHSIYLSVFLIPKNNCLIPCCKWYMTYLGQKHILTQVCFEAWNTCCKSYLTLTLNFWEPANPFIGLQICPFAEIMSSTQAFVLSTNP